MFRTYIILTLVKLRLFLYQGKGIYRYVGTGDGDRAAVGQLRTRQCLDLQDLAPSSIEITILDTGTWYIPYSAA